LNLANVFVGRVHIVFFIIFVIFLSYGLLFYLQTITEQEVSASLFDEEIHRQQEATNGVSKHIS
jgi:hypothetical protein